ncbi:2-oxoglutarate dehydrogenase, E2 component, dihydrolipoamide succinyltransferase [Streptomyces sp. NPDC002133]|uniref:2-oxoglutarate dehydrogenase, E2 component, dihydrolipoamide succinyltransferase n=1 Tax=Streptomyces sp. NPDC002133 TaxID=3154409 RepID=UPI00331E7AB8
MAVSVTLPALGESVTEGTVTRWLKQVGETVEADEPLLEVSTDKVDTEIPSPVTGVLTSITVPEDETVAIGGELAVVDDGTAAPAVEPVPAAQAVAAEPAPATEAVAAAPAANAPAASGIEVVLPALGESVTEGTVTRWLKQVGETVEADEPLLEVSTDKVDTEIPSPAAGVLLEITIAEDETAEVGAKLAVIGAPGSAPAAPGPVAPSRPYEAPAPAAQAPAAPAPAPASQPTASSPVPVAAPAAPAPVPAAQPAAAPAHPAPSDVYVTPLVRQLAAGNGVDLTSVQGSGIGGRIRKQDVVAAGRGNTPAGNTPTGTTPVPLDATSRLQAPVETSPLRGQTVKMTRIRKIIGDNLKKALHEQAQLTTVVEVDVTKLMQLRARAKEDFAAREGVKLSPMPFFVKAAAQALKAHPVINARINEGEGTITYFDEENIGIAVDTEKGLMTPVIKSAGDLNIAGIARMTVELARKARSGGLAPDDMSGATFTISNTGSRGALFDTVIVPPNQGAILGIGATVKRPAVVEADGDTVVGIRDMVHLSLSYDHRLVDGADAARYLTAVKAILETAAFAGDLLPGTDS